TVAVPTPASFSIDTTPPGAPTLNTIATPSNNLTPTVTWSAVAGASAFHVNVSQVAGGTCNGGFVTIDNTNVASTTFQPTLVGGAHCIYRFSVHARDALGNEGTGDLKEFVVDTVAPVVDAANAIKINAGAQFTNSALLSVTTNSSD